MESERGMEISKEDYFIETKKIEGELKSPGLFVYSM